MADRTSIEWTRGDDGSPGSTWNPVTGCDKVSPGCDHCYALTLAERFRGTPGHYFEHGFDVQLRPDKLDQPLRWNRPRRVFVNSMSDLFHKDIPDEYIAKVFAVMALAPQHTFQVLTKRHARMRSLLTSRTFAHTVAEQGREHFAGDAPSWLQVGAMLGGDPLPNVWLGVSAEDQKWSDIRIPALLDTPAAVRFVSAEPLLGPVDLGDCGGYEAVSPDPDPSRTYLDWVICGGESGPGARPMHPGWARTLRDQCEVSGTAFLFKQWGAWVPAGEGIGILPPRQQYIGESDGDGFRQVVSRVGKKAAGREIDGRLWDHYPAVHR